MGGDGTGRTRRRRPLHPEEKALWEHVTRSVAPMRPEPKMALPLPEAPADAGEAAAEKPAKKLRPMPPVVAPPPKGPPGPPPLAPLEPKLRRKLSRGAEVDARLDLHGMTQAAAHGRLIAFLRGAQGSGHALVLVITGKGAVGDGAAVLSGEGGRGVLRRLVPQWLSAPEMRTLVVGFQTAARGHGGEGALYVRVRRVREGGR